MSYTVFALKWRPASFDEVVGQNHIIFTLKSALEKNRLAHAFLFAGPRGVGKTSTARILAKALNCKEGPTVNPCGKCSSCLEIAQGRSLDVMEIDGASNRGIDEIRALRESIKFSPSGGKFKIYIIDEVHMLTTEAFNALLKTLEEPPQFVKFIFATTQPHKVIPTVLSRCQRFDFRRIPTLEIIAQLEKIVKSEHLRVDKEVLSAVARASDGALRDAESILDQLISFSKDTVSLKDVISVLGLVEEEILFEITDKIIRKDALGAIVALNNIIDQGKDLSVFLNHLTAHFRNLMVAKITRADAKLIDLPEDICARLLKQSEQLSLEEIFIAFNILINAQEMSKRLESGRIALEIALVKLASDRKNVTAALAGRKYKEEAKMPPSDNGPKVSPIPAAPKPEPEPEPPPVQQEQAKHINLEEIKNIWQNIIDSVTRVKISVATYLSEGELLKTEKNILTVAFPKNYSLHKESLEKKENRAIIEKTLSEILNCPARVNFVLTAERAPSGNSDHPLIRSALNMFNGRLLKED